MLTEPRPRVTVKPSSTALALSPLTKLTTETSWSLPSRIVTAQPCVLRTITSLPRKSNPPTYVPGSTRSVSPLTVDGCASANCRSAYGCATLPTPGGVALASTCHVVCADATEAKRTATKMG